MASLDKQLSIIVWSSPDFDSSSLSLVLQPKLRKFAQENGNKEQHCDKRSEHEAEIKEK